MIKFDKKIIQLGFGAVGKSFFEKVFQEIDVDKSKYIVISKDESEYALFLGMGGDSKNFVIADINRKNFDTIFSRYVEEGDILIDFADGVGTKDFVEWCANKNAMYLNTGETDWEDNWYNIFDENLKKNNLRNELKQREGVNKYPIVLHHGNNPGLVSHFVKAAIEYVVMKQFKKDEKLNLLLKENKFNEIAKILDIREIHVNDNDYQKVRTKFDANRLCSTWSIDSFFFEMLSEATANVGTNEKLENEYKRKDLENGFLEFNELAINKKGNTYYPRGKFEAFLVPHEETITISKSLEVRENNQVTYRPTVLFLYSPCDYAIKYLQNANTEKANYTKTCDNEEIVRGYRYPENAEILYKENIKGGTEYVGVLLLGSNFKPVWVGNRIKKSFLYKHENLSFWQTPTITPVAVSALAAVRWMIENKERGGIYFPDEINEYNEIINFSEKYISKTIYKTFNKAKIERSLKINMEDIQLKDILI